MDEKTFKKILNRAYYKYKMCNACKEEEICNNNCDQCSYRITRVERSITSQEIISLVKKEEKQVEQCLKKIRENECTCNCLDCEFNGDKVSSSYIFALMGAAKQNKDEE